MATVIMVAVILLVQTFASHRPGRSLTLEVSNMIWSSIIQPASFYVAHVNYFGPLVIVCTILWKHVCNVSHSLGVGFSLVMAIGFALSIGSGSRHLMNFVPFFILCTVIAVEDLKWRARQYLLIAAGAAVFSKAWLTIGPMQGKYSVVVAQQFPEQWFFMNHGPWMSHQMYVIQSVAVACMAAAVWLVCFRSAAVRDGRDDGTTTPKVAQASS
jgi:hypothetical protein